MQQQHHDPPLFASTPIEQVHEGMTVIDADGQQLGTVGRLQMGHPQAATGAGNEPLSPGLAGLSGGPAAVADGGPASFGWLAESDPDGLGDVPDVVRQNLRRTGYIQVDGSELEGANRFIPSDRIAEVSGNSVRLRPVMAQTVVDSDASRETVAAASAAVRGDNQPPVERTVFTSSREETVVHWQDESEDRRSFVPRVLMSAGATTLVFGGAGTAAWMYRRWRREQSRPINRLRRATAGLGLSLPDSTAATSGPIAAALLLGALTWARRSSRRDTPEAGPELAKMTAAASMPAELSMTQHARGLLASLRDVASVGQWAAWPPRRSAVGLAGGLLVLSGAGVLIWRSLSGRQDDFETEWTPPAAGAQDQPRASTLNPPQQTFTAPGAREQVTIERHPVDRQPADRLINAAEPESIEVPVHAEQDKPHSSAAPDEENSL